MFGLRSLRPTQYVASLRRCNATLQTAGGSLGADSPPPPPPPANSNNNSKLTTATQPPTASEPAAQATETNGRRRPGKQPVRRPTISSEAPRKYNRPIGEGVLPAYDLALKILQTDSIRLKDEAKALRIKVEEQVKRLQGLREKDGVEREDVKALEEEVEKGYKKLRILEVQSGANLPEHRWRVKNAMADMSKPVHRHLVEQRWRSEGDLDLLMERLYQMQVIPDVLGALRPTVDVHVAADNTHVEFLKTGKKLSSVVPGSYIYPRQTIKPPRVSANVFHTDTRLYTMMLVDPDVPNEEMQSFDTFLHWFKPNVPLSATQTSFIPDLDSHTQYIPPHPQRGTPYHRYVLLLLQQPSLSPSGYSLTSEALAESGVPTSINIDVPQISMEERKNFDVRAFMDKYGLDGTKGGGAHMWREIWDEQVSKIYQYTLKEPEPRYGRPPKFNPYKELKSQKRYI